MGDVIHMLSALQEARNARPDIRFDWVCEEAFTDLPSLDPAVDRVIAVAVRRWRKSIFADQTWREIRQFVRECRQRPYDLVIDAQGLLKTAWITALARCPKRHRWGFDWPTSREALSRLSVGHGVHAPMDRHAIDRLRALLGAALGYTPSGPISGLGRTENRAAASDRINRQRSHVGSIIFFHGTTRQEKSWPIAEWISLGSAFDAQGVEVLLPWGSAAEEAAARAIASGIGGRARLLPRTSIQELIRFIQQSKGVIGLDSGLMHLSVYLGVPTIAVMVASHLERFSADRFAPLWAAHARVLRRPTAADAITVDQVLASSRDLGMI